MIFDDMGLDNDSASIVLEYCAPHPSTKEIQEWQEKWKLGAHWENIPGGCRCTIRIPELAKKPHDDDESTKENDTLCCKKYNNDEKKYLFSSYLYRWCGCQYMIDHLGIRIRNCWLHDHTEQQLLFDNGNSCLGCDKTTVWEVTRQGMANKISNKNLAQIIGLTPRPSEPVTKMI